MRSAVHREGGLERTWRTSILPLLEEHHFGELDAAGVRSRYGLAAIDSVVSVATPSDGGADEVGPSPQDGDEPEGPVGATPRAD